LRVPNRTPGGQGVVPAAKRHRGIVQPGGVRGAVRAGQRSL